MKIKKMQQKLIDTFWIFLIVKFIFQNCAMSLILEMIFAEMMPKFKILHRGTPQRAKT